MERNQSFSIEPLFDSFIFPICRLMLKSDYVISLVDQTAGQKKRGVTVVRHDNSHNIWDVSRDDDLTKSFVSSSFQVLYHISTSYNIITIKK